MGYEKARCDNLAITSLGVNCLYCNFPSGTSILQRSCSVYKTTTIQGSLRITSSGEQKTYQGTEVFPQARPLWCLVRKNTVYFT